MSGAGGDPTPTYKSTNGEDSPRGCIGTGRPEFMYTCEACPWIDECAGMVLREFEL